MKDRKARIKAEIIKEIRDTHKRVTDILGKNIGLFKNDEEVEEFLREAEKEANVSETL